MADKKNAVNIGDEANQALNEICSTLKIGKGEYAEKIIIDHYISIFDELNNIRKEEMKKISEKNKKNFIKKLT